MSIFRRRISLEEFFERLRETSAECSDIGLEETEESQVEQATNAKRRSSAINGVKEYCAECNTSFGSAEVRVAVDDRRVMHEDCYVKHLAKKANPYLPASRRIH